MIREGSGAESNLMSIFLLVHNLVYSYSRVFTSRYLESNSITALPQGIFGSLTALTKLYVS